jgi:ADP-ribose pyrophosphatase YjhB (NUDIX family)
MKKLLLIATVFMLFSCHENLEDRAAREVKEHTEKKCPVVIDEFTIMDSITFDRATKTVHSYYSLRGKADTVGVLNDGNARTALLDELKRNTSNKIYKDAGFRFSYTYTSASRKGLVLYQTLLTPKDYQ